MQCRSRGRLAGAVHRHGPILRAPAFAVTVARLGTMDVVTCPNCGEENPARFRLCGFCGTVLARALPTQELRKTVTIVFSDLQGSTAPRRADRSRGAARDQEPLLRGDGRGHRPARRQDREVHRRRDHGGLRPAQGRARTTRCAPSGPRTGCSRRSSRINGDLERRYGITLANRTGVNTGEVVATGDSTADQRLADGDAVNVAARLEQAAPAQEILIGDITYSLVRDQVDVEAGRAAHAQGQGRACRRRIACSACAPHDRAGSAEDGPADRTEPSSSTCSGRRSMTCVDAGLPRLVTLIGDAGDGQVSPDRRVHRRTLATRRARCAAGACRTARASRSGPSPR